MSVRVWPGCPYPLGATWDGRGVNFALFSEHATAVELCLFDTPTSAAESSRITLSEQTDMVYHAYLPDAGPGQLYGYRVHGPYEPRRGHRFNPNKVLLDPYARAIGRDVRFGDELFGYQLDHADQDASFDTRDDAAIAPLGAVIDPAFGWGQDRPPSLPWHKTVIYELHTKGFTSLNMKIPRHLRGTYAGIGSQPAIRYLKELGVTAVELMPVNHAVDEKHLVKRKLTNYWGYNTLAFFAPSLRYARGRDGIDAVRQFKRMVRALHAAGIEVIMDVVYNHTAESDCFGPTLFLRGIDNAAYYRLDPNDRRRYVDYSGCGNTLNMQHPRTLQLVMDSLRYWVQQMHVDGFRFDLASALARELHDVNKLAAFFDIIHQDPVLSQVILIAEPWDLGEGGYQVGNFPIGWAEWNGKYRDTIRRFWRGDGGVLSEFASRLCGSSDLYQDGGRRPYASINYVTAHDGFTLADLVNYEHKHNEANGEANRDGDDHNLNWNCGVEGPTDDPGIQALRQRQKRNFVTTLLLSIGVPMLRHGDELSHTQQGNNNAYCHDSELTWLRWDLDEPATSFLDYVRRLIAFRNGQPVLHRRKFFQGRPLHGSRVKDLAWLAPDGTEIADKGWAETRVRSLGVRFAGDVLDEVDERGRRLSGDTLLLLFNPQPEAVDFRLPDETGGRPWQRVFDTTDPQAKPSDHEPKSVYRLEARSMAVLRLPRPTT